MMATSRGEKIVLWAVWLWIGSALLCSVALVLWYIESERRHEIAVHAEQVRLVNAIRSFLDEHKRLPKIGELSLSPDTTLFESATYLDDPADPAHFTLSCSSHVAFCTNQWWNYDSRSDSWSSYIEHY